MSFQLPATTTAASSTGGFSFGLATPATTAAAAVAAKNPPSFTFGATGGGDAGSAAAKPLTFGMATAMPAAGTATTLGGGGLGGGFMGATSTIAAAPGIAAAAATTAAANAPTLSLSLPKTTAPTLGLSMAPTATAVASAVAPPTSTAAVGGFANLSTATKTTDSASVVNASQMSYNQLEEHINKWTLELEEQEKVFTEQATQINAWDKVLISNNQKILELNDAVQKVKTDQQTLEQELEFIATQHKELEESILPLQKEFAQLPQVDVERSQTYLLVENLDTQLKQMSEDLKEIIDNLNESNKGQDNSDPIIQIGKILNAHMSSLQWIESSSSNICTKLDDITKMHDSFKRDSERSFRSAYYN